MTSDPKPPKEKVLHTRVPESLEAQIKALADALRVPVSSLVRNILEDSVAVIGEATTGIDETLRNVTKNVRTLSARAKADHQELRRGWTEFQTLLGESFRSRREKATGGGRGETSPGRRDGIDDPGVERGRSADQSRSANERSDVRVRGRRRPAFPEVIGWQALTLHTRARCAACDATLAPGDDAHLGLHDRPGARVVVCPGCFTAITQKARSEEET